MKKKKGRMIYLPDSFINELEDIGTFHGLDNQAKVKQKAEQYIRVGKTVEQMNNWLTFGQVTPKRKRKDRRLF